MGPVAVNLPCLLTIAGEPVVSNKQLFLMLPPAVATLASDHLSAVAAT